MNTTTLNNTATLFASVIGRKVLETLADANVTYRVTALDEKIGSLKSGEKVAYVLLTREDDSAVVISLHPETAKRLFQKGSEKNYTLLEAGIEAVANDDAADPVIEADAAVEEAAIETKADEPVEEQAATVESVEVKAEAADEPVEEQAVETKAEGTEDTAIEAALTANDEDQAKAELLAEQAEVVPAVKTKSAKKEKPAKKEKVAKVKVEKPVDNTPSKKQLFLEIFKAGHAAGQTRKEILTKAKAELNMGDPGANTYYQLCKSGTWK